MTQARKAAKTIQSITLEFKALTKNFAKYETWLEGQRFPTAHVVPMAIYEANGRPQSITINVTI